MKRIIEILSICLILAGTIIVITLGFNVGLKYSENTQMDINIGKEFAIKDIKAITNDVFKNKKVIIQQVELYKDMVQITVKDATDEQISQLTTKINEKYGTDIKVENISVTKNANTKLRTLIKPYIIPILISMIIILAYCLIIYRKVGILKTLCYFLAGIVLPQVVLFSLYAITRLPINQITSVISIFLYIATILLITDKLNKEKETVRAKGKNE